VDIQSRSPIGKVGPQVEVTQNDLSCALDFARRYIADKQHAGKGGWRGGNVKPFTSFGVHVPHEYACTVVGKIGEIALCRLAGVEPDMVIHTFGDAGSDLLLPCGVVQAKTTTQNYPSRWVRDPIEKAHWFCFLVWETDTNFVTVDGCLSRAAVQSCELRHSPIGDWLNRDVPVSLLKPITGLLAFKSISEAMSWHE
jgi:hypothetical protein